MADKLWRALELTLEALKAWHAVWASRPKPGLGPKGAAAPLTVEGRKADGQ